MNANLSPIVRRAGLLAGAMLALSAVTARGADSAATSDEFPNFESYIKVSGQAASVSGDKNAFENRTQQPRNGGLGVEELYFTKEMAKETTLVFDGRALAGAEDYLAHLNVTKTDIGSIDTGYKRFRTFYDGVGGFFPTSGVLSAYNKRALHLDRGKFWFDATLARPNAPVFTLRYSNETRDGQKDSTIWGDSDFTGMPNNVPPLSQVRKFAPSYINVGERTERLEFSAKHTIGKTTLQLTLLHEDTDNFDTRIVTRFPTEAKPFPTPAATVLLPSNQMNNQVILLSADGLKARTNSIMFSTDTALTEQLTLRTGFVAERVMGDMTGDRPNITTTPTSTGPVAVTTYTYSGLVGTSSVREYKGNASLNYAVTKNFSAQVAVKREQEYIRNNTSYNVVAASGTPATTLTTTPRRGYGNVTQNATTPELEVRYSGIRDLALYATASKRDLGGREQNTTAYNPLTASNGTIALNNVSEDHGNYTLGANWRQSGFLTLRGELFKKNHQNEYVGYGTGSILGDYYLLDNQFTGVKLTAVVKPNAFLTSTTRYVVQKGTMQVTGYLPTFPAYDSCDAKNAMIGETVDWTPNTQFYAQANLNVVFNSIGTIYPRAGTVAATSTNVSWDANQVLQNSNNDYITGSIVLGFVASKTDDVLVQANYYRANDGDAYLAIRTMPYGVDVKDVSVTVGVKHKFSDRLVGDAKVGYFDSNNQTTGGYTNYHGPLAYVALEYRL